MCKQKHSSYKEKNSIHYYLVISSKYYYGLSRKEAKKLTKKSFSLCCTKEYKVSQLFWDANEIAGKGSQPIGTCSKTLQHIPRIFF